MEKRDFCTAMNGLRCILSFFVMICCTCTKSLIEKGEENLLLGDYSRATRCFSRVLDKQPRSFDARLGLGKAYLQHYSAVPESSGLLRESLTHLEAARTLAPDTITEHLLSSAWYLHAQALLVKHDTLATLAAVTRSISYNKQAVKPLNLAGILYFYRGEREKALSLFTMATAIDTAAATGYFNAGMVYWADSNFTKAYTSWFEAAKRSPDDKEILGWTARAKQALPGVAAP